MSQYLLSIMKGQRKDFVAKLITWLLLPFSFFYGIGVFCHRNYYRFKGAFKAPKPVISIGNITVGGSGKTPLVIWMARNLQNKGFKSIILIRGYMPFKKIASSPSAPRNDTRIISDEVDMMNEQIPFIPVIPGANRVKSITMAEDIMPVDVYIADDAFQHWPLGRNFNIVAIDSGNPFGNGHLLPAGILREPLSALKRADVIILTKIDDSNDIQTLTSRLQRINPKALIMESRYKSAGVEDVFGASTVPEDFLKEKNVVGFCAIGDPISFESSLKNSGAKVSKLFTYMDHHVYTKKDIRRILDFGRSQKSQVFVTTHKDAVKLRAFKELFSDIRLVYIPIQLEVTKGSDEFFQKVISVCRC